MSSIYKILNNPFYAGMIVWNGQSYQGRHERVVSIDEFNVVRRWLARLGLPKQQRREFAFTGMIRCGGCGLSVTAGHKVHRHGHHYVYYHCSRPRLGKRCEQPSIRQEVLEQQIGEFLQTLIMPENLEKWLQEEVALGAECLKAEEQARMLSLRNAIADTAKRL